MNYAYRSFLLVLVSSLLTAQDNLPRPLAAPAEGNIPAAGGGAPPRTVAEADRQMAPSSQILGLPSADPSLRRSSMTSLPLPPSPRVSWASAALFPGGLLAGSPEPTQSPGGLSGTPVQAPPPKNENWVRRHAALLAGLAMTGGGAALVATGGPGPVESYCIGSGPTGPVCTPPGPVWLGAQRLTGVLLMAVGVPVAIVGLIKHH
jgi:hypothetical protein